MTVYKCECCYETYRKSSMRKHLNRKSSCIPEKDMKIIDINTLVVGEKKPYENLTFLTNEQKLERHKEQKRKAITKQNRLGEKPLDKFANFLLQQIKSRTKQRNHKEISWKLDNIIKILENNKNYIVPNTILGDIEFPMMLTNGYHNTASFDRIDNNLGYLEENIEIRPCFLNTRFKITTDNIKKLLELREQKQDLQELIKNIKYINNYNSTNFFYRRAASCKARENKERNKTFNFESIHDCSHFLIKKYIEQGGRCAYSHIPIYPIKNHKYSISVERINPIKGYSKNNIVLIVIGLNGQLAGQYLNKNLTDEEKQIALEAGKFNQEYWNQCTKMTKEIFKNCEEAKNYGNKILLEYLSEEMKNKIF